MDKSRDDDAVGSYFILDQVVNNDYDTDEWRPVFGEITTIAPLELDAANEYMIAVTELARDLLEAKKRGQ